MAKMGKKRKSHSTDFPKKKNKLGKGKRPADNATKVSFKSRSIVLPSQLTSQSHSQPTGKRKLTLEALLRHLNHFKSSMRCDGLTGLRELFKDHPHLLLPNLSKLINGVLGRIMDSDSKVRHFLYTLLNDVFSTVSLNQIQAYFSSIVVHLSCGLTHISDRIQLDSLKVFGLVMDRYPTLLPPHTQQLLPLVVGLISRHKSAVSSATTSGRSGGGKKGVGLSHDPRSKLSKSTSRIDVFGLLSRFLHSLLENSDLNQTTADENSKRAPVIIDIPNQRVVIERNGEFIPVNSQYCFFSKPFPCVMPLQRQGVPYQLSSSTSGDLESVASSPSSITTPSTTEPIFTDVSKFYEFANTLFSILVDSWVECSPPVQPQPTKDTLVMMELIINLLCLVLKLEVLVNYFFIGKPVNQISEGHSLEVGSSLGDKYCAVFLKHFMANFPLHCPDNSSLVTQYAKMNLMLCQITALLAKSNDTSYRTAVETVCVFYGTFAESSSFELDLECSRIVSETAPELLAVIETHKLPTASLECVLSGLNVLYSNCHPHSSAKKCLIHCFKKLLQTFSSSSQVFNTFLLPWLESLPQLLVDLGKANPTLSAFIIDTLTSTASYVSLTHLHHHLITILEGPSSVLAKLSPVAQRKFVELLWLVPTLSPQLLTLIREWVWSPGEYANSAVASYMVEVIHQRFLKRKDAGSDVDDTIEYLVFMMGLLLGGGTHSKGNKCNESDSFISLFEEDHVNIQYRKSIINTVCECLKSTQFSDNILDLVAPTLQSSLEKVKSLPVDYALAILSLVQCLSLNDVVISRTLVPSLASLCFSVMLLEQQQQHHQQSSQYTHATLYECWLIVNQILKESHEILVSVLGLLASEITVESSRKGIAICYLSLLDSTELNSAMRQCSSTIHTATASITERLRATEEDGLVSRIKLSTVKYMSLEN